jgi:protein-S-isoprenylcysteine O-methyltransferase Ste14
MLLRALVAFLALPGFFAGIAPWVLASVDPWRIDGWPVGRLILVGGLLGLLWCVRDFYIVGKGTLAPWDPPKTLVIVGLYQFTRNPMYVSALILVIGWATWLGSPLVAVYAVVVAVAFHLRVVYYEEPRLEEQFGASWMTFAANVPRWLPRLRPWRP